MDKILKEYDLTLDDLKKVRDLMTQEMEKGLSKDTVSSIKMLPSFVQTMPSGKEFGKFLALDLGGTNFRVLLIELKGSEALMKSKIYALTDEMKSSNGDSLFNYIVDCLEDFIKVMGIKEPMSLGFTFSFPVIQHGLASGTLVQWTKEIDCAGVVGNDVVQLLQKAIDKRKNVPVKCVALVNDTVGCLMSCAFEDNETAIGVIIGTGTNASYVEKLKNIGKLDPKEKVTTDDMIINMEWGGFGDNGCIDFIRTDVDKYIDQHSVDKGKQLFEKMISGKYLGEIARQVIVKCVKGGFLFKNDKLPPALENANGFPTNHLSEIESDSDGVFTKTKKVLTEVGIKKLTDEDCRAVWKLCNIVSNRSSSLVSAGIAAVLNKMGRSKVTVGVDGSLYRFHPHFSDNMIKTTRRLSSPGIQMKMKLSEDGSGKGAAVIAAVAAKGSQ